MLFFFIFIEYRRSMFNLLKEIALDKKNTTHVTSKVRQFEYLENMNFIFCLTKLFLQLRIIH